MIYKTKNTPGKNIELDRPTIRHALTLLKAYRTELSEQMATATYSHRDNLSERICDIKETVAYLEQELSR